MIDPAKAVAQIEIVIHQILKSQAQAILIGLDGASGSGKSTLASMLAEQLDCVIVPLDDFFAANVPDREWDAKSVPERARDVFDWPRVRTEALEPLLAGRVARWHPFDFAAGLRPDGTYSLSEQWVERQPAAVTVLEGAYSCSPQLANLLHLKVLLEVPVEERHRRLEEREKDKTFLQRWHMLWDEVENYYFHSVMPESRFDLVLKG